MCVRCGKTFCVVGQSDYKLAQAAAVECRELHATSPKSASRAGVYSKGERGGRGGGTASSLVCTNETARRPRERERERVKRNHRQRKDVKGHAA